MPFGNPFKRRQSGAPTTTTPVPPPDPQVQQGPTTGPLPAAGTQGSSRAGLRQASQVNLVNYSPEELMQQVEGTLSRVHFGMSFQHKLKENVAELWAVIGPAVLFAGTAGEVYFFIWQHVDQNTAWWVGLSVLATVIVLECTFMVLSYKCDTLRNQLRRWATDEDRRDMARHHRFWFILAAGVAFGQILFLIATMMAHFNGLGLLIAFALGRSVVTLAADYYTAFVHKAKPTTGEEAKRQLKERAELTADLLKQKGEEVTLINDGTLRLRQAQTEATIKEEKLTTHLQVERLQNQAQIETLKTQQEQATMFTHLGNNMMRALFDPNMSDADREKLLNTMQGFMAGVKQLPPGQQGQGRITDIREEDV